MNSNQISNTTDVSIHINKEMEYCKSVIYLIDSKIHKSIIYTVVGRKFKKGLYYDEFTPYTKQILNEGLETSKNKYNKTTIITHLDLKGITMKHVDTGFVKKLLALFQNEYEDTLEKLIITNIPIFFKIAYKIVRPFIDKDTKKKIYFEKKSKNNKISEFTNNDDILEEY